MVNYLNLVFILHASLSICAPVPRATRDATCSDLRTREAKWTSHLAPSRRNEAEEHRQSPTTTEAAEHDFGDKPTSTTPGNGTASSGHVTEASESHLPSSSPSSQAPRSLLATTFIAIGIILGVLSLVGAAVACAIWESKRRDRLPKFAEIKDLEVKASPDTPLTPPIEIEEQQILLGASKDPAAEILPPAMSHSREVSNGTTLTEYDLRDGDSQRLYSSQAL